MPRAECSIGAAGPILEIRLRFGPEHEAALHARKLPVPSPSASLGLIDTGAERTAILRPLAESLGLRPTGYVAVRSAVHGPRVEDVPVYTLRLSFGPLGGPPPRWKTIEAVGVAAMSPGVLLLIGRDLLATCRFRYDGPGARLTLSY